MEVTDKDVSVCSVVAWGLTSATVLLLACAWFLGLQRVHHAALVGWTANVAATAAATAHVRGYFVRHGRRMRLLLAGQPHDQVPRVVK